MGFNMLCRAYSKIKSDQQAYSFYSVLILNCLKMFYSYMLHVFSSLTTLQIQARLQELGSGTVMEEDIESLRNSDEYVRRWAVTEDENLHFHNKMTLQVLEACV